MGLLLCGLAFALSWHFGRRSVGAGMTVILAAGYGYGLVRAVVFDSFSHFLFDAAVAGLYAARFGQISGLTKSPELGAFYQWVALLIGWPFLVLLIGMAFPVHPLIQLVGLRAAIWFLPFLIIGTQVTPADLRVITRALALLNLVALAIGVGEYVFGLETFLPRNGATDLIYQSRVTENYYRIPSTFSSAGAYGGMLVASWPFLAGRWGAPGIALGDRCLLTAGLLATGLGVFLCACRTPVVLLFLMLALTVYLLKLQLHYVLLILLLGTSVGYFVVGNERLQRFTSLQDQEAVGERIHSRLNVTVLDLITEYPMGAGLGSAFGTSIPSFLTHLAPEETIGAENEYSRIATEQGLVGLCLWIVFLGWFFTRTVLYRGPRFGLYYPLTSFHLVISWGFAWLGTGVLLCVPYTAMLLFQMGWVARSACQRRDSGAW